jgi:hypothetical protein
MKRFVASRLLKRTCSYCNTKFKKGDVYYCRREVYKDCGWGPHKLAAFETLICPKCKYKQGSHNIRFKEFQMFCSHPNKFIKTVWSYIPGECVKEPNYDFCSLCGKTLV